MPMFTCLSEHHLLTVAVTDASTISIAAESTFFFYWHSCIRRPTWNLSWTKKANKVPTNVVLTQPLQNATSVQKNHWFSWANHIWHSYLYDTRYFRAYYTFTTQRSSKLFFKINGSFFKWHFTLIATVYTLSVGVYMSQFPRYVYSIALPSCRKPWHSA